MVRFERLTALLLCCTVTFSVTLPRLRAAAQPATEIPRGFIAAQWPAEMKAENVVFASPSEVAAQRHELALASHVHRMGSQADYRTAVYVRDALAKAGWDAHIVTYVVPIAWPSVQSLSLVSPVRHSLDLYEAAIPGDSYSRLHNEVGIPFSGYSTDGDVTGRVVYANYAVPEDFDALAKAGVSVKGAIIVARAGKGAFTSKDYEAVKHGAAAVLIFPDPMDGGYFKGDPYPAGPWRPTSAALRHTETINNAPGDPTAIGVPVPGAQHKPFSAIAVPPIPEMPITADVARQLIAVMGGPVAPADWHGGFALPLHLGGAARAHLVLKTKRFFGPIWDVIATLRGNEPNQMVVVGGHRDAWTFGSIDPISGTVDLVQLGEAFGKAVRAGWKPRRTVVIGSWDGEELNLFGSEAWVEQHEAELRAGCVAYVNTDEVAFGPTFGVDATPDLIGVARAATSSVRAPDGSMLDAYWSKQDPKREVGDVGGGSDHEPFVFHENLPAAGGGFFGPFGTYHSAYDDPASLRVFDPGMHRAAAAARFTSALVMRLADATAPDVRLGDLADALSARLDAFAKPSPKSDAREARRAAVVAELRPVLTAFVSRAHTLDAEVDRSVAAGDAAAAETAYAAIRETEARFYDLTGSGDRNWSRSLLYKVTGYTSTVLPTLDDTLDPQRGDAALRTLMSAFAAD